MDGKDFRWSLRKPRFNFHYNGFWNFNPLLGGIHSGIRCSSSSVPFVSCLMVSHPISIFQLSNSMLKSSYILVVHNDHMVDLVNSTNVNSDVGLIDLVTLA